LPAEVEIAVAALRPHALFTRFVAALPTGSTVQSAIDETHPAVVEIPDLGPLRVYLWTITRDQSATGRPPDEFKIQITLPGQSGPGQLDLELPHMTVLLGFSPDFGVFVAWEARLHQEFGASPNIQVKEGLLEEARDSGWAVASPRRVKEGREVRVAFSPTNFGHFLSIAKEADTLGLTEEARVAYFLFRTPGAGLPEPPDAPDEIEDYTDQLRERLAVTRLRRDSGFTPRVKEAYGFSCAICGIQMEVVESAHIIEVREAGSTDDLWNGIALCAVHHKLFDAHLLVVRPTLEIAVNNDAVLHLHDRGRAEGIDRFVTPYDQEQLTPPKFFAIDAALRNSMQEALRRRLARVGLT
jgi:putative restriction endonuclease